MSWLNPIAFVGLVALAVPILVHLFGRRVARQLRFPSLRLLRDAKPTPATRSRPSDVLLLVLRCLAIAAAVTALAQPWWSGAGKATEPVRVVVVDTSNSMQRLTSEGTTAVQAARGIAERMIDSSSEALVVETERPGSALAGAGSWLSRRGGTREVVVISDFQAGAVTDGDLAALPTGIGTRMVRVMSAGSVAATQNVSGIEVTATPERTSAIWPTASADSALSVSLLAGDKGREQVESSIRAVRALVQRPAGTTHNVTVVFPGAAERSALASGTSPLDSAWQGDLVLALQRDPLLASVLPTVRVVPSCQAPGTVIARNFMEEAIASVARGANGVLVFACVEPGSLVATAFIATVESALGAPPPMRELEPNFLPDETLRQWERPAIESAPRGPGETSPDGRWIWLIALVFLIAEEFIRRRRPRRSAESVSEVRNERVA